MDRKRFWLMAMKWHDLMFMHWPLKPEVLRPLLPAGLALDTYQGEAWIGIVPFRMTGVRPRLVPPVPGMSAFPELNVRTYVTAEGKRGVWFFSLDAANRLAVRVARWGFHLPYFDARMQCLPERDGIRYMSLRTHRDVAPAEFIASYRPTGPVRIPDPGSLDDFLTMRLCLYSAAPDGTIYRGDIAHPPWPLQPAEAEVERNTMADQLKIRLPDVPPLLHFAKRLDVVAWRIRKVASAST